MATFEAAFFGDDDGGHAIYIADVSGSVFGSQASVSVSVYDDATTGSYDLSEDADLANCARCVSLSTDDHSFAHTTGTLLIQSLSFETGAATMELSDVTLVELDEAEENLLPNGRCVHIANATLSVTE